MRSETHGDLDRFCFDFAENEKWRHELAPHKTTRLLNQGKMIRVTERAALQDRIAPCPRTWHMDSAP